NTGYGVAVDSANNVIVAGSFQGATDFGGTVLTSVGSSDSFVAKYGSGGGPAQWAHRYGSTSGDIGYSVTGDGGGKVGGGGVFGGHGELRRRPGHQGRLRRCLRGEGHAVSATTSPFTGQRRRSLRLLPRHPRHPRHRPHWCRRGHKQRDCWSRSESPGPVCPPRCCDHRSSHPLAQVWVSELAWPLAPVCGLDPVESWSP